MFIVVMRIEPLSECLYGARLTARDNSQSAINARDRATESL